MSDQTATQTTTTAWTGYTEADLAWFAEYFGDTEWAVHVAGPDEIHTHAGEDVPVNPPFTAETAARFAADVNALHERIQREDPSPYNPFMHATVLHFGVPVTRMPAAKVPFGARVRSAGWWITVDRIKRGDGWVRFEDANGDASTWLEGDTVVVQAGQSTTTAIAAPHEHSFPIQPPHGSLTAPGDCDCGAAYTGAPVTLTASGDCEPCQGTGLNIGQPGNCPDCRGTGSAIVSRVAK